MICEKGALENQQMSRIRLKKFISLLVCIHVKKWPWHSDKQKTQLKINKCQEVFKCLHLLIYCEQMRMTPMGPHK